MDMMMMMIGPSVLEVFEIGGRTDNRRMVDEPWLYYKLSNEPKGSGELIMITGWRLALIAHNYYVL